MSSLRAQAGEERSAAPPAGKPESTSLATLAAWADQIWLSLLDRDGAYFGRLAEEGTFQRFNSRMDHEYELDLRSGLFTAGEDARWTEVASGLRVAGASISHPHILTIVDWHQEAHISGPVDLVARYRRERSLTARRDYPWIGIGWRDVLGTPWTVRVGLGVHFFKPSADVELALARSWGDGEGRHWELEARVAALDAFNDAIFQGLGVRADEVDAHFDYAALPLAARTTLRAAASRWRAELRAGSSRRTEVRVTFPATGQAPFSQLERVMFVGALFQVTPLERVAVVLYGTWARADTERRAPASGLGFTLREQIVTMGARARGRLDRAWTLEAELARVRRPEWRTPTDGAPLEHRDRELFARTVLARQLEVGWTGRLSYALLDRDAGSRAPRLTALNQRLTMEGGYRFGSGFEVTAGLRWDLDHFAREPFDGGHLRLSATW